MAARRRASDLAEKPFDDKLALAVVELVGDRKVLAEVIQRRSKAAALGTEVANEHLCQKVAHDHEATPPADDRLEDRMAEVLQSTGAPSASS